MRHHRALLFRIAAASLGLAASSAPAQTSAVRPPAWVNDGYRGASTTVQTPFDPTRAGVGQTPVGSSAANTVIENGDMISQMGAPTAPYGGSVQARFDGLSGGAGVVGSGAGAATATAIGNLMTLSVSGSGNTVVVDNRQTNTGAVSARAH